MKYLKIVVPVFFLLIMNCTAQQSKTEFDMIDYKAQTRGSLVSIKVVNNDVFYVSNGIEGQYKLSDENLSKLSSLVKGINLDGMSALKAPSEKRITDGALHADFKIKVADKAYKSITFDAGNPPKELKDLELLLYSLAKLNK